MEQNTLLEKLNKFTRRELAEDEVYTFTVTLCDNEIDRDNERFSRKSLEDMAERFIGVTGIFDHNPTGENQTARLFHTELVEESGRLNSLGEPYVYLKGYAYMVRTASNSDLIREIDGGIKKEVSVSCSAERQICSVCGADRREKSCRHVKGRDYDGGKCFVTLDGISDAYEWSFVAVPAQLSAGVTKKSCAELRRGEEQAEEIPAEEKRRQEQSSERRTELEGRIRRALVLKSPDGCAERIFESVRKSLTDSELEELGKTLAVGRIPENYSPCDNSAYMMRGERSCADEY